MDGEGPSLKCIAFCATSKMIPEQEAAKWRRYHLVRLPFSKELRPGCTAQQFSTSISPPVSARPWQKNLFCRRHLKIRKCLLPDNAWWKSLASTAIAASVAAAVVIRWQQNPAGCCDTSGAGRRSPTLAFSCANGFVNQRCSDAGSIWWRQCRRYGNGQYAGAMPVAQTYSIMPRSAMYRSNMYAQRLDEERFNRYLLPLRQCRLYCQWWPVALCCGW